mmetsp:Transcript_28946/g.95196  ORF Transcript_28946/g.95196 Transcript_28946/m.95196 type:complete len:339 (-) Transcript_28946:711-1727(-)
MGGRHVNLTPGERPADVYAGVLEVVKRKVAADAAEAEGEARELALQLDGRLVRKVVKQSVMTTVYGVTFVGMREQIERRLRELPELAAEVEAAAQPDRQYTRLASYLAKHTMSSLGEVFEPAMVAMEWLASCASAIGHEAGSPVEWTTPLGLPVVQPYHKPRRREIRTVLQRLTLSDMGTSDDEPVDVRRQVMGIPPNYVHSLDSSHMLMTASAAREAGIAFAAVHDSFWSHACDADALGALLRDQFVELHRPNLLQALLGEWRARHSCSLGRGAACEHFEGRAVRGVGDRDDDTRPRRCSQPGCARVRWDGRGGALQLPKRGNLDLDVVRQSPYFFS